MTNITEQQIHSYQEDGVVCLRNVFDDHWIELVRTGIAAAIKTPGPSGENYGDLAKLNLTRQDRADLVNFMKTLSGQGWQHIAPPNSFPE
jgi:hypothetical protein